MLREITDSRIMKKNVKERYIMNILEMLSNSELQEHYSTLSHSYEIFQAQKLKLNMARGKPCPAQLDLSSPLIDCLSQKGL